MIARCCVPHTPPVFLFRVCSAVVLLMMAACGTLPAPMPSATPLPPPLVTSPPDSTATPTPFQPLLYDEPITGTPVPFNPIETGDPLTPGAFDPGSLLPGGWTPTAIANPGDAPPPFPVLTDTETVTFLLLGSDLRSGRSFRTDSIIIAALRPRSGQVTLISVPRDLYIYIPTRGMDRINTAYLSGELYNYPGGGAGLLKDSLLYNLGIRIDHVAMVDFDGFRQIVDTLQGIDVPVVCSYTDWRLIAPDLDPELEENWALYTVGPGLVHMDGDLALWYARSRQKSSDFDRGRRQQEVLRTIYTRALQVNVFGQIPQLYDAFRATIITDLTLVDLLRLSPMAFYLTNADIRSYYIGQQYVTPWTTPGGGAVLLPNGPAIQGMLQQALSPSSRTPQAEAILVEIRNGTVNAGWDALAAQRLNYAGYETRSTQADRTDYPYSLLYDLNTTPDPAQVSSLLAVLGLPTSAMVAAPTQGSDTNYVLIVGADYQPCFNPVNMAP
ncbi:MAG: LCP family protein [Chloroflexota bacterium]